MTLASTQIIVHVRRQGSLQWESVSAILTGGTPGPPIDHREAAEEERWRSATKYRPWSGSDFRKPLPWE